MSFEIIHDKYQTSTGKRAAGNLSARSVKEKVPVVTDVGMLKALKKQLKLSDWSQYTDNVLLMSIARNVNDYDAASEEVTKAAIKKALQSAKLKSDVDVDEFAKSFTAEMCKARWSYLGLMRKMKKVVEYDGKARFTKKSPQKKQKKKQPQTQYQLDSMPG